VVELLRRHGGRLMAVARRYSMTREDAEDAYQRAVEILLTRAPSTDPADLLPWMKTVVKHEAFAVGKHRTRHVPSEAEQIEPLAGVAASPAELVERRDRLRLGAEALGRLKPQEVRALLLRAEGLSYREICAATGWSYTKVNRCLSEGRQSFAERVAGIEAGDECDRLAPLISALADGEASDADLAALRPHLGGCLACRARLREYRRAPAQAAAVAVPAGLAGWLWECTRRAVHLVSLRLDGVAQAAAANKAAAVAASAAVVAGGGVATVRVTDGGWPHRAPAVHRRAAEPARARPAGTVGAPAARSDQPTARPLASPTNQSGHVHRSGAAVARRGPVLRAAGTGGEFAPGPPPAGGSATGSSASSGSGGGKGGSSGRDGSGAGGGPGGGGPGGGEFAP
jgi:RNA polymerase sigma factor (sigma-70 family)